MLVTTEGEELWVLPEGWYTLGSAPDAHGLFPACHQLDHADPEMWRREGRDTCYLGRTNRYLVDKTGDVALELTGEVRDFAHGVYATAHRMDGTSRYGLIDRSGAEILAPEFDNLRLSRTDKLLTASRAGELLVRTLDGSDVLGRSIPLGRYPIIPIVTDGQLAYVDLASNRTVLLDLATDQEVARIPSSYNGIHGGNPGSLWGGFYIVHVAGGGWSYYGMDGAPIRDRRGQSACLRQPQAVRGLFQ